MTKKITHKVYNLGPFLAIMKQMRFTHYLSEKEAMKVVRKINKDLKKMEKEGGK